MSTAIKENPTTAKVVSPAEWLTARKELLRKEKEFTRLRDELSRARREMPWEKVEKNYVFDGPQGKESLADLFDGRGQSDDLSLHVRPGMERGMPKLLVPGGRIRRRTRASGAARHHVYGSFTGDST